MYDFHRDMAELNARMQKTARFAATLVGRRFEEADVLASRDGYVLQRIIPDPAYPPSGDLRPNRIRCRVDEQDAIVDTEVG